MINHIRLNIGSNLADLFKSNQEYCLEQFKWFRNEMSSRLNFEVKPIFILSDNDIEKNIVQLIDTRIELLKEPDEYSKIITELEFNDRDDELSIFLVKMMYIYEEIFKEESTLLI